MDIPGDQIERAMINSTNRGNINAAAALEHVQDFEQQEILVDSIIRSGRLMPFRHAIVHLCHPSLRQKLTQALLRANFQGQANWGQVSIVAFLEHLAASDERSQVHAVLADSSHEAGQPYEVEGELGDSGLLSNAQLKVLLVNRLLETNDTTYVSEALQYVPEEDLQKVMVACLVKTKAHERCAAALRHVRSPFLRQQLIRGIVFTDGASESALVALRLAADPLEKMQLLIGISDPEKILQALWRINEPKDQEILVQSLVEAKDAEAAKGAFFRVKDPALRKNLIGVLADVGSYRQAFDLLYDVRDTELVAMLVDVVANNDKHGYHASMSLRYVKDPSLHIKIVKAISDPKYLAEALNFRGVSDDVRELLIDRLVEMNDPKSAYEAIRRCSQHERLLGIIVDNRAHREAAEALLFVKDETLRERLVDCIVNVEGACVSAFEALKRIEDLTQRIRLVRAIKNPYVAVGALANAKNDEEKEILAVTVSKGRRGTAIERALKIVESNAELVAILEAESLSYGNQITLLTEEIVSDDLDDHKLFELVGEMYNVFLKLASEGKELRGPAHYTGHGEAVPPDIAGRCVLDAHRTRAFLKGGKLAIDKALKDFDDEILVLDPTAGPFGALNIPLALLFKDNPRVKFLAIDVVSQNVAYHTKVLEEMGLSNHLGVKEADAIKCRLSDLFPNCDPPKVVIVEAMLEGLTKEPQVAVVSNLFDQVHPQAIWVPHQVELELELHPKAIERDNPRLNVELAPDIPRYPVTTISDILAQRAGDAERCLDFSVKGSLSIPDGVTVDSELQLATRVITFPGVVLHPGASDISSRIILARGLDQVKSLSFEYSVGQDKDRISVTKVDVNGNAKTRTPWSKHNSTPGWGYNPEYEFRG